MKILITGVSGFIGRNLAQYWGNATEISVMGIGRGSERPAGLMEEVQYRGVDYKNDAAIENCFLDFAPDVVVHCAAMSKPNECEEQPELCRQVNVQLTQQVLKACRNAGSRIVFMSTDFVFGDEGPYQEEDEYSPVNLYGRSKMEAELLVKEPPIPWAIVRTVLVYGRQLEGSHATFPQWVKGKLTAGEVIKVFTDQIRTPTYVSNLVNGIDAIVQQQAQGVFHLGGAETLTPFEMALQVANYLKMDTSLILPITRADWQEPARRPLNSTLNIDKAAKELGYHAQQLADVLPNLF